MKKILSMICLLCILTPVPVLGAASGTGMNGVVTDVNPSSKTLTIRNGAVIITFEVENPRFSGYRSLGQVQAGDVVNVRYAAEGIVIEKAGNTVYRKTATKRRGKKQTMVRARGRVRNNTFAGVDENEDGKVSATELSVVRAGLTMKEFSEFDLNGDGCLDRKEFECGPGRKR